MQNRSHGKHQSSEDYDPTHCKLSLQYFPFSICLLFFLGFALLSLFTHCHSLFCWFLGVRVPPEPDFQVSSECKSLFLAILNGFVLWVCFDFVCSLMGREVFELIFAFFCFGWELVQKARIQIWLFEQRDLRIEGRIIVCFMAKLIYAFFF